MNEKIHLAERMKQIMQEKGLEPKDYIKKGITSSRLYSILDGKNVNPKLDIISEFCEISGIEIDEFLSVEKSDEVKSLTETEQKLILLERQLPSEKREYLLKFVELYIESIKEK